MILAAGLQSGGTSLVSWCFLQHPCINGVLDMPSDLMRVDFDEVREPIVWCKTTIASFRWVDVANTYRDLGWTPEPLLIVRDVRSTYSSLSKKWYGFNGVTAEDPPLRMRFRRFLEDWSLFREKGWPTIKYEELVERGEPYLMEVCEATRIPWDDSMVRWPKRRSEVTYVGKLNETFEQSMEQGSLATATRKDKATLSVSGLPISELEWLEEEFSVYNDFHGYPKHVPRADADTSAATASPPRYEGSVRDWLYSERITLNTALYELQREKEALEKQLAEIRSPSINPSS